MPTPRGQASILHRSHAARPADRAGLESSLGPSPWLVVVPHDDDLVLGSGMTLRLAAEAGIEVHVAVCTDGSMGYGQIADQPRLVQTRRAEMARALDELGLQQQRLRWLDFPDGRLPGWLGARPPGERPGLGQALAQVMREVRPGTVFGCHERDVHPDHRAVAWDVSIACFWAASDIWLELGEPIALPRHVHYGVYSAFEEPPDWCVQGAVEAHAQKLAALAAFESQSVISELVEQTREDGAVEYFKDAPRRDHRRAHYAGCFVQPLPLDSAHQIESDISQVAPMLERWPAQPWPELVACLRRADAHRPLWLVGEGSSQAFPVGIAMFCARGWGMGGALVTAGGREAALHGVPGKQLCLLSNSGRTRELAELRNEAELLIAGVEGAPLAQRARHVRTLLDEPEQAVAATVSVLGQALTLLQALATAADQPLPLSRLRRALPAALAEVPPTLVARLAQCERLWWVDPGHRLGEELALKSIELCGMIANGITGTRLLHGSVEVLGPADGVIWFDPPASDLPMIREELGERAGAKLVLSGEGLDWACPDAGALTPLLQLVQGWRLLIALARARGRNPDAPKLARKVGNPMA